MSRLRFVSVYHELVLRELDAGREVLGAYLHLIGCSVPYQFFRMDILDIINDVVSVLHRPTQFHDADTLANRIKHIYQHIVKVFDALELFIHKVRDLFVPVILGEWLNLPVQSGHGKFSGLHLREEVRVFLLHLLKEFHLCPDIPLIRLPEYPGEPSRGQTVGGIVTVLVIYIPDRHPCRDRSLCPGVNGRVKRFCFFPSLFLLSLRQRLSPPSRLLFPSGNVSG